MVHGYNGKILHVNLTNSQLRVEEPDQAFYRKYMGGSALAMYYLLKEVPPGADPLGADNVLVLDANANLESIEAFHRLGEHMNEYEPNDTLYQAQNVPVSTSVFQVKGGELGSYKVLTP